LSSSSTSTGPQRLTVRQRVHPIRRGPNRITVVHTDSNNNLAGAAPSASTSTLSDTADEGGRRSMFSPESPRQPQPPSIPRPPSHRLLRRNLSGISTANIGVASTSSRAAGEGTSLRRVTSPASHVSLLAVL
jgi:hypothetical protein